MFFIQNYAVLKDYFTIFAEKKGFAMIRRKHLTSILQLVMVFALLQLTLPIVAQPWEKNLPIMLEKAFTRTPVIKSALPVIPTWKATGVFNVTPRLEIPQSHLNKFGTYVPKIRGPLESLSPTLPDYTAIYHGYTRFKNLQIDNQLLFNFQKRRMEYNNRWWQEYNNKWWTEYIGGIIDEQMSRLRLDKMEKQLFKNGINIDTELENDTVGYIIYHYEYKPDAA